LRARQRRWGRRFRSAAYAEAQPRLDSWQQKEAGPRDEWSAMLSDSCTFAQFTFVQQRCPDVRADQGFGLYGSCGRGWMLSKECACYHYEKS